MHLLFWLLPFSALTGIAIFLKKRSKATIPQYLAKVLDDEEALPYYELLVDNVSTRELIKALEITEKRIYEGGVFNGCPAP